MSTPEQDQAIHDSQLIRRGMEMAIERAIHILRHQPGCMSIAIKKALEELEPFQPLQTATKS